MFPICPLSFSVNCNFKRTKLNAQPQPLNSRTLDNFFILQVEVFPPHVFPAFLPSQRQLRLQDAKKVEAKAAKIKEWVTNKLKEVSVDGGGGRRKVSYEGKAEEKMEKKYRTQGNRR